MKIKTTKRKNGSFRVQHDLGGKTLTDQSYKNDADVNVLVERWKKTGVLAEKSQKQFVDLTHLPSSFEEAHDLVQHAWSLFNDLPAVIRKKMGNDPANLEEFLNDPENQRILEDYGLKQKGALSATKKPSEASSEADPASTTGEGSSAS